MVLYCSCVYKRLFHFVVTVSLVFLYLNTCTISQTHNKSSCPLTVYLNNNLVFVLALKSSKT